jgi:hypothetical protein
MTGHSLTRGLTYLIPLSHTKQKIRVGWREWASLPDLEINNLKVKIDTGAKTSSLHAENIKIYYRGWKKRVRFEVHPKQKKGSHKVVCTAIVVDERVVTNSGGQREKRYFIKTPICLGGMQWNVEISLTDREKMKFPMLLGREAMRGHIIVDPQSSYLMGKI